MPLFIRGGSAFIGRGNFSKPTGFDVAETGYNDERLTSAEYPSGLRGRIANPLFMGSNPISACSGAVGESAGTDRGWAAGGQARPSARARDPRRLSRPVGCFGCAGDAGDAGDAGGVPNAASRTRRGQPQLFSVYRPRAKFGRFYLGNYFPRTQSGVRLP